MTDSESKPEDNIFTATVVGAGTMGAGIAQVLAMAKVNVQLFDIQEDLACAGLARVDQFLQKGVARGKLGASEAQAILNRISPSWDIKAAATGSNLVVEAVPERADLKREVFASVVTVVEKDALLATNTSSLSISLLAENVPHPERFLGMHFFNPPPLMPLVEIVRGKETADAVVEQACSLTRRLGKHPIVVLDSPGFASSRLGVTLGLEAMRMLEEGVASAADLDAAMELGYRHPMGPLKLTDLVGLDVRLAIAEHLAQELDEVRFAPPQILRDKVAQGELGVKTGQGFHRWAEGKIQD